MHLRFSTKRINGKTYRYAQIVESYRRNDGVSTKRVLANLGVVPRSLADALRLAFKAASSGDALVLQSEVAELLSGSTLANRRYLDLAVLIDCWRTWNLSPLLDELAGEQRTSLSLSDVVLPLVLQRCCAPRSKLAATRWVPTTALPELLGLDAGAFHNSRIHRALETLFLVTEKLQRHLPQCYQKHDGPFGAMFMDVTDTYFEGIGAPMAEQTRTKTEMPHKRCLGIVLLANEHGYPLRWKVVGGKTKDWDAMGAVVKELGQLDWLRQTPMVFDRAMGNQKTVAALKREGTVKFLTAAHVTSIESYTMDLPYSAFAEVELEGTDESYKQDIERVAQAARDADFDPIHSRLFCIELGVALPAAERQQPQELSCPRRRYVPPCLAAEHLRTAYAIHQDLEADSSLSRRDIAQSLGVSSHHVRYLLSLLRLSPAVQQRILQWDEHFTLAKGHLKELLHLDADEQLAALEEMLTAQTSAPQTSAPAKLPKVLPDDERAIGPLRLVAYFNARLFVDIRRRTEEHCQELQRRVEQLNADLAVAKRSRDYNVTYRKFARELERLGYLDTFQIEIDSITLKTKTGRAIDSFQGRIIRDEQAWQRRRRYDGFVLLLGHPQLGHSAKELVNLYRIKDTVEKDFQSIKSVIKLRPIYSYTDPKVQAHVTICMLALLVQRTLERRLRVAGLPLSAPSCIDILSPCHLNQRHSEREPIYDVTRLDAAQRQILETLGLEQLADEATVRSSITPRPATQSHAAQDLCRQLCPAK